MAKEKFDVDYLSHSSETGVKTCKNVHKVVSNTYPAIEKFLSGIPQDSILVAEHTGLYGDLLSFQCGVYGIKLALVNGNTIHSYRFRPDREKTDEQDCRLLRDYGERYEDKLRMYSFPEESVYELRQLSVQRERLVESRKKYQTVISGEGCRPYHSMAIRRSAQTTIDFMNEQIEQIEREMLELIQSDARMKRHYEIITSVKGIGLVTAIELIVKTQDFETITTARQYAAYAGVAPYRHESGKAKLPPHISRIGNRRSKTLLYTCAGCAAQYNKEIQLFYKRRHEVENKPHFWVLNAITNKLLRIVFTLIKKNELFVPNYICNDPRQKTANRIS